MNSSVAVIGAGPAGLMAAEVLAGRGIRVVVLEQRTSPGRKFLLAGRSGLNLTNAESFDALVAKYGRSASRLEAALRAFGPDELRSWARGLGVETFVGSSGRVFPIGMKATPLLRAWLRRLDDAGVLIRIGERWTGGIPAGFDAAVLALGGASWPRVGSDGGWVELLRRDGIDVNTLRPANAGILVQWTPGFVERFHGTPLKNVAVTFAERTVRSDLMITRTGLEGTAVYTVASLIGEACHDGPTVVGVDLFPDFDHERLRDRLAHHRPGDSMTNRLRRAGLDAPAIGVVRDATGNRLPTDPDELASLLRAVPLRTTGTSSLDRAISSAGGIDWNELDDRFMLKRRPGLFVAGEMIDWDAPTGGYLLQACLSTGAAAARGVIDWLGRHRGRPT